MVIANVHLASPPGVIGLYGFSAVLPSFGADSKMKARSPAGSRALEALLHGLRLEGTALDERHLWFAGYLVSLTEPGAPRMPNGIETEVVARPEQRVAIGNGSLMIGDVTLSPGAPWNPVPSLSRHEALPPGPEPLMGDDVLAGYVAGLVLLHKRLERAQRIAVEAAARTNALSGTLLRHAAYGEVPEPVHTLLLLGDPAPLLRFGHNFGQSWLRGLVSAGFVLEPLSVR